MLVLYLSLLTLSVGSGLSVGVVVGLGVWLGVVVSLGVGVGVDIGSGAFGILSISRSWTSSPSVVIIIFIDVLLSSDSLYLDTKKFLSVYPRWIPPVLQNASAGWKGNFVWIPPLPIR